MKKIVLIAGLSLGLLALGNLNNGVQSVKDMATHSLVGNRILKAGTFVTMNPLDPITVHATTDVNTFKQSLPTTAKAVYSDGSEVDVPVTFSDPSQEQISKKGTFELAGEAQVEGSKKQVSLQVEVVELIQVSSPKLRVQKGQAAVLPSEVYAVYSDGSYVAIPVTFPSVDTAAVGTKEVSIKVTVDGVPQDAKATVDVVEGAVTFSYNRYAKSISVNDTPIPNFANTTGNGNNTGGYGTEPIQNFKLEYGISEAVVTAESFDANASTLIIQGGIGEENPSYVFVFPEDGSYPFVYTVTSTNKKAALLSVDLSVASERIKVGEVITPTVTGTDEAGNKLTSKEGAVIFTVDNNYSGLAQVDGKEITALQEGLVRISASMEYEGKTLTTKSINLIIEKGEADIYPTSVKESTVVIRQGQDYALPKSVEVVLSNGSTISRSVSWSAIPDFFLSRPGTFTLQGKVYGYEGTTAKLTVTVITSGQGISSTYSTTMLTGKPTALPSSLLTGFESDGTPIFTNVSWDQDRFNSEFATIQNGQSVDAWYQLGSVWAGTIKVFASDGETSGDLTQLANGYDRAPAALASRSVAGATNKFVDGGEPWVADKSETTPYVGFLFGNAGVVQKTTVDTVKLTFNVGNGTVLPSKVDIYYFNKELDNNALPSSYEPYLNIKATGAPASVSPFAEPANWTLVTNQSGNIAQGESTFSFDAIDTYAFRAVFSYTGGNTDAGVVSVGNVVATNRFVSLGTSTPELSAITVGGTNIYVPGQTEYTLDYENEIPEVTASLADGSKGTVVVANNFGDESVRIKVLSEDGQASQLYTVRFKSASNTVRYITDVKGLSDLSIQSANTASELTLPSTIGVTLDDGSEKEIPVTFNTSLYQGKKGRYLFEGTLVPDDFTINALDLKASIAVDVREDATVAPNTPADPSDPSTPTLTINNGLRGGDIAAIVLGTMLGLVLVGGLTYFFLSKNK